MMIGLAHQVVAMSSLALSELCWIVVAMSSLVIAALEASAVECEQ